MGAVAMNYTRGREDMKGKDTQAIENLFKEKSPIARVQLFDEWLRAHGFQRATSMDPELGPLVECNDTFFYFQWNKTLFKKKLLVATIRNGEVLLWEHDSKDGRLNIDNTLPDRAGNFAAAYIMDL